MDRRALQNFQLQDWKTGVETADLTNLAFGRKRKIALISGNEEPESQLHTTEENELEYDDRSQLQIENAQRQAELEI